MKTRSGAAASVAALLLIGCTRHHAIDLPNIRTGDLAWPRDVRLQRELPIVKERTQTDVIRDAKLSVVRIELSSWNPRTYRTELISTGTGFVIDSRGYVLTNNHVAWGDNALSNRSYAVEMDDGTVVTGAKLVGRDELTDLAVLDIRKFWPKSLRFADHDSIVPGLEVHAIGFAKAQDGMPSLTRGIVSGLDRDVLENQCGKPVELAGMLQTDAAINGGNSGGPLIDKDGRVVGVNTAGRDDAQGMFFAVPARVAETCARRLIADGEVRRSRLGVETGTIDRAAHQSLAENHLYVSEGALVKKVGAGSPAEKAGIAPGDIIVRLGSCAIRNRGDLSNARLFIRPGETVEITYIHYMKGHFEPGSFSSVAPGDRVTRAIRLD